MARETSVASVATGNIDLARGIYSIRYRPVKLACGTRTKEVADAILRCASARPIPNSKLICSIVMLNIKDVFREGLATRGRLSQSLNCAEHRLT